jgi:hypothetical protein
MLTVDMDTVSLRAMAMFDKVQLIRFCFMGRCDTLWCDVGSCLENLRQADFVIHDVGYFFRVEAYTSSLGGAHFKLWP